MEMKKVLVEFIQDRSFSMKGDENFNLWLETVGGFKTFVEKLRKEGADKGIDYTFSLTTFDTLVDTPIIATPINKVDLDVLKDYGPRGSTALYDAVGTAILNIDKNRNGAEKVICVIVTDGQENSSREWKKAALHTIIDERLNAGDWTFMYLGTQPETWDDAGAVGINTSSVASYTPTMARAAYTNAAAAVNRLACDSVLGSRSIMADYLSDDELVKAGMHVRRPSAKTPVPPAAPPAQVITPPVITTTTTPSKSAGRWR